MARVSRELDAPQDESWFPSEHPDHEEEEHNMMGFFNPPSMVGNRQTNAARQGNDNFHGGGQYPEAGNPLAALMQMFSGGAPLPGTTTGPPGAPRIRTFTLGNGAGGGGFISGATISIGGPPTLGRDEYGYIRDPWGEDPFGQARAGGQRSAEEAARDRFAAAGNEGFGFAEYRPEPGVHVTIEDLLSHFLGGMTGLGGNGSGSGHLGDYVLSDEGLDQVLEQLMNAAGEHNRPPPASDLVINGLPRIKLDQATLEFELGEEVIRIPCKFFTGGNEEHPAGNQESTSSSTQRQENQPEESAESASSTSRPPGAFPRPVSPTVDDHPDHPINTISYATNHSHTTTTSSNQHANPSPDRATRSEQPSPDHEDVRDVDRPHSAPPADTSAARFLSNLFEQPGGSPLSGNAHPRSPGPMGTASYFGRTSSPPQFIRNPSNPPFVPNRDFPSTSAPERESNHTSTVPRNESQENKDSVPPLSVSQPPNSEPNNTARTETPHPASEQNKHDQQAQQDPHEPIYPTVIPAEYRERQARREAMIREQEEQRSGRSEGESTDEHTVSAQIHRDYTTPD
ncbi:hypothetical protein QFC22_004398 [Naganishia vaughanmartiniae]|uniref:Uncharacterized protein n=1 Tax=Naganishia vaughanmartiniae TaxID=1424756 RepID=A0ACC2X0L6_9TREE|nr:hypothetical protein QFC22_004398 [Naganishia vaughanmartiniae]